MVIKYNEKYDFVNNLVVSIKGSCVDVTPLPYIALLFYFIRIDLNYKITGQ